MNPVWPLFDLEVRTPRLTMRYLNDDLLFELVELSKRGVHDPATMPFAMPWTDEASPMRERTSLRFFWQQRVTTNPTAWSIPMAVIVDDQVVGMSALEASDFPTMRQFETGSWLGIEFQGQGIGKELRAATLQLGFVGFGADYATTGAWHDNGPSLGVTRSLGYTETGRRRLPRRDQPDWMLTFGMDRAHFETAVARPDIELINLDPVREFLNIAA